MNIINRKTAHNDKDPFAASERVSSSGKGDKPRNVGNKFKENYDAIDWGRKKRKATIVKIGTFDKHGRPTGWHFDGFGAVPASEGAWCAGYTLDELREIAKRGHDTSRN